MTTRTASVIPAALLALLLTACAGTSPEVEAPPAAEGADDLVLDDVAYRLDGSCVVDADGVVADFEAVAIDGDGYAQLRFTGESGADARATFSLDLGQGLIASDWDGAVAVFDSAFQVVVGDGVLSGSGVYLDPVTGTERDVAFRVGCSGAAAGGVEVEDGAEEPSSADRLLIDGVAFTPIATCVELEPVSVSVLAAEDADVLLFAEGRADGTGLVEVYDADDGFVSESGSWDPATGVLALGDFELRLSAGEVVAAGRVTAPSRSVAIELHAAC